MHQHAHHHHVSGFTKLHISLVVLVKKCQSSLIFYCKIAILWSCLTGLTNFVNSDVSTIFNVWTKYGEPKLYGNNKETNLIGKLDINLTKSDHENEVKVR